MATLDRLGFCQRCGDPVSGKVRCSQCGGSSAEPKVRTSAPPSTSPRNDPWASRYVSGNISPDEAAPSASIARFSPRASTDHGLGLGMPSRISKDLRTNQPERGRSSERLLQAPNSSNSTRATSQDYTAPVVQSSNGVLSKVCGSLVEPSSSRKKWACHDCNAVFARDTTIFAPPTSSTEFTGEVFFCKPCYSTRYGLGQCQACHKEVLGSTKEDGKFVKASSGLWHGRCWKCCHCDKGAKEGVDILVGMDGRPCCEGCFGKPKAAKRQSVDSKAAPTRAPDVRSELRGINRPGAGHKGPMGAAISELSKKFGTDCSTVRSPTLGSGGRSPTKGTFAFPDHLSRSPSKTGITRSGSITGSPTKPRPMTAQFTGDLNLAAFKTSVMDAERSQLTRSDSRSRSQSPTKRASGLGIDFPPPIQEARPSSKVPGSPNMQPTAHLPPSASMDPSRERTFSGFPRPLNTPFSKTKDQKEPIQGDKNDADSSGEFDPPPADTVCSVCHKTPFDGSSGQEVVMVTLQGGMHMHADCFTCVVCRGKIDGTRTFSRLDEGYAHPHCAPTVTLRVVREVDNLHPPGGERILSQSLEVERNHVTHQRELRPSPTPSPASTVRDAVASSRATLPTFPSSDSNVAGAVRRFQPSAGAAPPTRSTILAPRAAPNPAAGIFARTTQPSTGKFGGMQSCAYCGEKISALESVIGPRSTQWHRNCLICRGEPRSAPSPSLIRSRYAPPPRCGKKLDSGAKVTAEGEVRCRDCFDRESSAFRVKV